jgi:uncharacterized protein
MKELVEYIARGLVDSPDAVVVDEVREGGATYLHLDVAEGEFGRVIGRDGKLANAMRVLLRAGNRRGRKVVLDIGD